MGPAAGDRRGRPVSDQGRTSPRPWCWFVGFATAFTVWTPVLLATGGPGADADMDRWALESLAAGAVIGFCVDAGRAARTRLREDRARLDLPTDQGSES